MKLNNSIALFLLVLMTLPNLGQLVFGLPVETKQRIRRFERCSFKVTRTKCSQTFNTMCVREGLLPRAMRLVYQNMGGEHFRPLPQLIRGHVLSADDFILKVSSD